MIRVKGKRWDKNRWCRLTGHPISGYQGGTPYGQVRGGGVDGIGVEHKQVYARCDHCGEQVLVIQFHHKGEAS